MLPIMMGTSRYAETSVWQGCASQCPHAVTTTGNDPSSVSHKIMAAVAGLEALALARL
jgi:hypothetical protein